MRAALGRALGLAALATAASAPLDRPAHLNSKTPYGAHLDDRLSRARHDAEAAAGGQQLQQCEATALYAVLRHGTRYPTAKDVRKMGAMGARVRVQPGRLPPRLGWLDGWTPPFPGEAEDGALHDTGRREHHALAQRLQAAFPTLFPPAPDGPAYAFSATAKPRTQQSAQAFAAGLAGADALTPDTLASLPHAALGEDPLLRFHKMCPRYESSVKDNATLDRDAKGGDPSLLRRLVARRLGATLSAAGVTINPEEEGGEKVGAVDDKAMKAVWKVCQMEQLLQIPPERSDWCGLLSDDDILVMETLGDLDMYWEKGPGLELPSRMACELLQDAAAQLGAAASGDAPTTTLRFAHAETVVPLLGILGIGTDTPPLRMATPKSGGPDGEEAQAAATVESLSTRSWRMSDLSPMAANVVLVLRRCGEGLFLSVLHNEVPVALPRCPGGCPWEAFLAAFEEELQRCSLAELCAPEVQDETCAEAGESGAGAEEPVVEEPKLSRVRQEGTSEYLWRWGWRICAGLAALSTLLCVAMPAAGVVE